MKPVFEMNARRSGKKGFTLVEVILSLGVVSFGLVSTLGLLTVGIQAFHETINTTTETQIVQQLANQLSLADYSVISASVEQPYYFSQEGIALTGSDAAQKAIYSAKVSAPTQLTVPGGSAVSNSNTLTFVISVWSRTNPKNASMFPIQIANDGS